MMRTILVLLMAVAGRQRSHSGWLATPLLERMACASGTIQGSRIERLMWAGDRNGDATRMIVCCTGVFCASLPNAGQQAAAGRSSRRLMATGALSGTQTAKQCMWVAETKSCEASDAMDIMYAVRGKPVSPYLW